MNTKRHSWNVRRYVAALCLAAVPAFCQTSGNYKAPVARFARDLVADQKAIWSAPAKTTKRQWLTVALPIAAVTAGFIAADRTASNGLPNTPDQLRWSRQVSDTGAVYALAASTVIPIVQGSVTGKRETIRVGVSAAEAIVDSLAVNFALKYVTLRERPDYPGGNGRFYHSGDSFPSGHAMTAWAAAAAIGSNRRTPRWLTITTFAAATAVSLARVGERRHFPSDVFFGSAAGILIGRYVAHKNKD